MTQRARGVIVITFLCTIVAACGSQGPAAPTAASFGGNWVGAVSADSARATLQMALTQDANSLSGSWTIADQNGRRSGGTVTGRVSGSSMSAVLALTPPTTCPFSVSGTLDPTGTQMTGTLGTVGCTGSLTDANLTGSLQGGFTAARQ